LAPASVFTLELTTFPSPFTITVGASSAGAALTSVVDWVFGFEGETERWQEVNARIDSPTKQILMEKSLEAKV
jgi:hypothetical protein